MEITIRHMEAGDADAVSVLVTQLGYERSAAEICDWLESLRRERREQVAFVAIVAGEVAGWIEVSVEHRLASKPHGLIGGLVVKDGVRSSGIGRRLCAHAETWTWDRGLELLRVASRSTRADAHRFYLRDGYREVKKSMVFEKSRPR